jgi:hypothetical protein
MLEPQDLSLPKLMWLAQHAFMIGRRRQAKSEGCFAETELTAVAAWTLETMHRWFKMGYIDFMAKDMTDYNMETYGRYSLLRQCVNARRLIALEGHRVVDVEATADELEGLKRLQKTPMPIMTLRWDDDEQTPERVA